MRWAKEHTIIILTSHVPSTSLFTYIFNEQMDILTCVVCTIRIYIVIHAYTSIEAE